MFVLQVHSEQNCLTNFEEFIFNILSLASIQVLYTFHTQNIGEILLRFHRNGARRLFRWRII